MRPIGFWQAILTLAGLGAIAFSQYAGPAQATLVASAVALLFWLRQPPSPPSGGAAAKAMLLGVVVGVLGSHALACQSAVPVTAQDARVLIDEGAGLDACERKAEASDAGKQLAVYHDCVHEAGL